MPILSKTVLQNLVSLPIFYCRPSWAHIGAPRLQPVMNHLVPISRLHNISGSVPIQIAIWAIISLLWWNRSLCHWAFSNWSVTISQAFDSSQWFAFLRSWWIMIIGRKIHNQDFPLGHLPALTTWNLQTWQSAKHSQRITCFIRFHNYQKFV